MYTDSQYIVEIILGSTGGVLSLALGLFCILIYSNVIINRNSKNSYVMWFGVVLLITGIWALLEVWNEEVFLAGYELAATYLVGTTLPLFFYIFVRALDNNLKFDWNLIIFNIVQFFVIIFILHPEYGLIAYKDNISSLKLGSTAHLVFVIYMLLASAIGLVRLLKISLSNRISSAKNIFIAIIIPFSIVAISNIVVPYIFENNNYHRIGPLGLLIMSMYITYIIVQRQALKIPIIIFQLYALGVILIVVIAVQFGLMFFGVVDLFSPERLLLISILSIMILVLMRQTLLGVHEETEVVKVHKALQLNIRSKNQFIQISSHQLRTPITAIKGYLSLLQESHSNKKDTIGIYISQMNVVIQNMSTVIEDVLSVNELNTGKFGIRLKDQVNLKEQLDIIIENKSLLFEKLKITYNYQLKGKNFILIGDQVKLKEVLNNALDNALQYGKSNIDIRLHSNKDTIKIIISDDGIGVTKSEQKIIFKAYSRGNYAQQIRRDGTGLGLHLMKLIIEGHGGNIRMVSKGRNKGSSLHIELPKQKFS